MSEGYAFLWLGKRRQHTDSRFVVSKKPDTARHVNDPIQATHGGDLSASEEAPTVSFQLKLGPEGTPQVMKLQSKTKMKMRKARTGTSSWMEAVDKQAKQRRKEENKLTHSRGRLGKI